ncbi:MAG: DinB family protein [Planctomycetaceae bacterium]|nr:DinB family protein [Planctomycetaceae bacterium]
MSLSIAITQINAARDYTLGLLADLPADAWFFMPNPPVTHIAWQVGHLSIAQYRIGVAFQRDPKPEDASWLPANYRELFGRDSIPQADPTLYPTPDELLANLHAIHQHVMAEVAAFTDADLTRPIIQPHRFLKTYGESLFWCSRHESVHAGQIALLRRLHGLSPQW